MGNSERRPSLQVLLQVLIIITGNYNFFNLLTLVLTTSLLDDRHLAAEAAHGRRRKTPACECPLSRQPAVRSHLSFPCTVPAGLSSGSPASRLPTLPTLSPAGQDCLALQPGPGPCWPCRPCGWNWPSTGCWPTAPCTTSAWRWTGSSAPSAREPVSASWVPGRAGRPGLDWAARPHTPSSHSLHLPPVLPVAEDGDPAHHVAGGRLPLLGIAGRPLEVEVGGEGGGGEGGGRAVQSGADCT